ncbi:MAG TPA: SHOCT domain-containing protein [Nitrosopumilaceae archaeon]|nr:SHOCT domain-containing protein [Nitrosopumilaceae archaeon]
MIYPLDSFKIIAFFAISCFLINPISSFAQEEFDSKELGFGVPYITVSPTSGPPGTQIEIEVKNMPVPPKGNDPRIEFFVYLPFITALGSNVPNNCDDEHCFPLYSFEEINEDKIAQKTITFGLFSKQNPKSTLQGGEMESVCDLKVNGKTIERYSTVCNTYDQPIGEYEIKFAWGIQGSNKFDVRKIVVFTVTEGQAPQIQQEMNPDDIVLEQYKNGEITEEEFEKKLSELGYDAEGIRKAKALLGKLPHQQGSYSPEQKQAIEEGIIKAEELRKEQREQAEEEQIQVTPIQEELDEQVIEEKQDTAQEQNGGGCLIATATYGSELAPQIQLLREIRDNVIFGTNSGTAFMAGFNQFYYSFSPTIADWERQNLAFKELVKITITPMLSTLSILNFVNIDSEQEMLTYGIGIILLNLGMYFVAPAVVIIKTRQFFKG